jgi:hypothetical protein
VIRVNDKVKGAKETVPCHQHFSKISFCTECHVLARFGQLLLSLKLKKFVGEIATNRTNVTKQFMQCAKAKLADLA